ncbi:hypothetical protein [Streptomyces sp. SID12501]|uniref:Uncharacterized protein n=1 Tax=Streptomyces sp. SID12501 TaxID=2706042 RepID=A0A6B3BL21_9ACTN|nr:hypothetical protein [Streptomyces sp. SID12501]NEC84742.1 hypothetical protein [Streptomyces sp. SID12501]
MLNPIRRIVCRLSLLLAPGTGIRRSGARYAPPVRPVTPVCASLPAHRSPYGLHVPLDGAASRLVRPYLPVEVAA